MTRCREKVTTHKTRRETFGQIPPSQPPEGTNPADTFFFFFWLRRVFVAVHGLFLVVVSRGYSLLWLLTVVASLVAEHRL